MHMAAAARHDVLSLERSVSIDKFRWLIDAYMELTPAGQRAIDACLMAFVREASSGEDDIRLVRRVEMPVVQRRPSPERLPRPRRLRG